MLIFKNYIQEAVCLNKLFIVIFNKKILICSISLLKFCNPIITLLWYRSITL